MWLHVGHGSLIGAAVGTLIMLLISAGVVLKAYFLQYAPAHQSTEKTNANLVFAFWLDGLSRRFSIEPIRMVFEIYVVPIMVCAVIGFAVENVARLF
jgi:hypothetical protein